MADNSKGMGDAAPMAIGVAVGIALGAAIGVALGNIALWIGIGLAIGAGIGVTLNEARKRRGTDDSSPDDTPPSG